MNYFNEVTTYQKKNGKLYEVITREIDLDSLNQEITELENQKADKQARISKLLEIKNT